MLVSLAMRRMLKHREGRGDSPALVLWRRIWQARLDQLEAYLLAVRQLRKAQSMGVTRRRFSQ